VGKTSKTASKVTHQTPALLPSCARNAPRQPLALGHGLLNALGNEVSDKVLLNPIAR
jgi:hypothetical protein